MIISETLSKIHLNSARIAKLLKCINDEISEVSSAASQLIKERSDRRIFELEVENSILVKQVEEFKQELIRLRIANNIPQIPMALSATEKVPEPTIKLVAEECYTNVSIGNEKENDSHFGLLSIKVGKILEVEKHPNAEKLYVEKVDFGEPAPSTILSALVSIIPIEEMQNRLALFLTNLKPQKMRGIISEGMIMCAGEGENIEILIPPEGSVPGDIVRVEGYEYKPEPVITPKKNIFKIIAPHLKVNQNRIAEYKGIPWNVGGKGPATTRAISNVIIG